jgi:hypothetical protein
VCSGRVVCAIYNKPLMLFQPKLCCKEAYGGTKCRQEEMRSKDCRKGMRGQDVQEPRMFQPLPCWPISRTFLWLVSFNCRPHMTNYGMCTKYCLIRSRPVRQYVHILRIVSAHLEAGTCFDPRPGAFRFKFNSGRFQCSRLPQRSFWSHQPGLYHQNTGQAVY